ncbi:MAG: tRNA (adenosine(37)-N6)-dimethylallyltransferase MiaA [Elusimicrobia bacterium CG11_big_fil_rev_8_21_14_0_20_64_6]|nr:MAG: tRNA (adenosine(37)-N6)-dimethylallyltransferase MiaA [Elusimicrobia bacterium CG11_big_fil_rev_8_21_14_0_20_64_6]
MKKGNTRPESSNTQTPPTAACLVLAGPTASGKTDLAVALSERIGAEVVSADSRQVYRRLDAGTAKPSAEQCARVPHWLLDRADPSEMFDAARFAKEAAAAITDIRARGKVPLVCGGTGLYLRALLEGLSPLPPRDEALRARLNAEAEKLGRAALHARLAKADPEAAAGIPPANIQRVVRALEVFELTGKPISAHWREGRGGGMTPALALRLELTPELSRRRIEARAKAMWPGLLAEVKALVPNEYHGTEPGFTSLGYREALACSRGELPQEAGLAELIRATAAYAKRQRTWFRNQLDAAPLDASAGPDELLARAVKLWEKAREKTAD